MYNFLNDSENVLIQNRISDLLEQQLPSFIQEEGGQFINFLKTYYKWMETHELTIYNTIQNELRLFAEDSTSFILENGDNFILESGRTDQSAFIEGETIVGVESGATGTVDRNTFLSNDKIYVKDLTKIDFKENEIIVGESSRTQANVKTFFKNPLFASRTLLKNIDLNTSTSKYIDILFNEFLVNFNLDLAADKAHVIKHIIEVYRAKGTSVSYDFLFKTLYDEQNLIFYAPKDDVFKLSSGDWVENKILRISSFDPVINFEGRQITGIKSSATAIIDRIERFALGNLEITELYLDDIRGRFVINEIVRTNIVDGVFGEGKTLGVLTNINVISTGTNYEIGDLVTITGGGGLEAAARVKSVSSGILTDFGILDGGDGYSEDTVLTVNNFGTRGSGFAGRIEEIQSAFTYSYNSDIIFDFAGVLLSASKYGMSGDPNANHFDRLVDALGFRKVNSGPISSIKTLTIGSNYQAPPTITAIDRTVARLPEDSGIRILNLNADPDSSIFTPAITGSFNLSERIYTTTSNGGTKIGTFFGLVYDEKLSEDPSRMRVKTLQYLGVYGLGANDLILDNSNYLNQNFATIYDILVTVGGKDDGINRIVYRRGLKANDRRIDNASTFTDIEYIDESQIITSDWQTLKFPVHSIVRDGSVATVTTNYKHGLNNNLILNFTGSDDNYFNGQYNITVTSDYTFTYNVVSSASAQPTGDIFYDEGMLVKFTTPYNHDLTDRFLVSTVDFSTDEIIIGYDSGASATINSGAIFSPNLDKGENARIIGSSNGNDAGAISELEITNIGAGYTSNPSVTALTIGDGNAILTANIGTIANTAGKYADENGFLSYGKKIYDGYYYQDYSYVLKSKIQLAEYEEVIRKLIHPVGMKMFGEYIIPTDEINFSFDNFLTFEDGSPILLENQYVKRIIAESYFEPNHTVSYSVREKTSENFSGTLVRVEGGNNIISATSTIKKLNEDFEADDLIIIDDEQKFIVSFGELRLEGNQKGKIISDSQNTVSRLIVNLPTTYEKSNIFVLENYDNLVLEDGHSLLGLENFVYSEGGFQNFEINVPLYQRKSDGQVYQSIISKSVLDNINGNLIIDTHTLTGEGFDLDANVYTDKVTARILSYDSNLIFATSYDYKLPKIVDLIIDKRSITFKTETNHNIKINDNIRIENSESYLIIDEFFRLYDGIYVITDIEDEKTFKINTNFDITDDFLPDLSTFSPAKFSNIKSSDFQNNFKVGDVITFLNNDNETKIRSIINSSCISTETRIDSDSKDDTFNLLTENYYNNDNFILEDSFGVVNLVLESRNPIETIYDKKLNESHFMLEQTIRGVTSANGLNDGIISLKGIDTKFHKDLLVGDIISLSTKPDKKAKILEILDFDVFKMEDDYDLVLDTDESNRIILEDSIVKNQELVLNVPLGNGTNNQSFILFTNRNLDLEENGEVIHLNKPYDGKNNYVYVKSSETQIDEGQLLLEDGIGTQNFLYSGTTSTEGKLLFEEKTIFNDVELKIEIKS